MKKTINKIVSIILMLVLSVGLIYGVNVNAQEPDLTEQDVFAELAFPSAEGHGRFANGFRGGKVVEVTNLNSSGEGSLKWALEEVTGPRIIVFKVGGVINIEYGTGIADGNVYIAGQTAPGDGITICGSSLMLFKKSNVVVRYLRIRTGYSPYTPNNIEINCGENIIIDHCSFSWGGSCIYTYNSKNLTVQNCIIAETVGDDGSIPAWTLQEKSGSGFVLDVTNGSFYRNLITNCFGKIWGFSYDASGSRYGDDNENIDIRNNVVYNWQYSKIPNGLSSGMSKNTQFVNNYYKKGENTGNEVLLSVSGGGYVNGNKIVSNSGEVVVDSNNDDPWSIVSDDSFPDGRSSTEIFDAGVNTLSADDAFDYVIENVGASLPARDYIDERYINEVINGTHTFTSGTYAGCINTPEDAEGYPDNTTFTGGEAPLDTDHDGMPDEWEIQHGLNPEYYYDACQVYLSDEGYTNVELYINELAGDDVVYSDDPKVRYNPVIPTPQPTETPIPTTTPTITPEVTETPKTTTTPEVTETPLPTHTPEVTETPLPTEILMGDVDNNQKLDANDALLLLQIIAKIKEPDDNYSIIKNDFDKNNVVNAEDVLVILKIAAKLESEQYITIF